jgi:hypothetical protein
MNQPELEQWLEANPDDLQASRALEKIYEETESWDALVD